MSEDNVVIKKVSPYPFAIDILIDGKSETGQVAKVTTHGFLAYFLDPRARPMAEAEVSFRLPASESQVKARVKVVKIYDTLVSKKPTSAGGFEGGRASDSSEEAASALTKAEEVKKMKRQTLVEMHFLNITDISKAHILEFKAKIGEQE